MVDVRELFQSVEEDQLPIHAKISGKIPDWLKGSFLRVGPGCYEFDDFKVNYWLDGYSVLSSLDIDNNDVTFQRKFLQSDAYTKSKQAKKTLYTEFGTKKYSDPSKGFFSRMLSSVVPGDMTDNTNLNCYHVQGQLVASGETCFLRGIDHQALQTKDKIDLSKVTPIIFNSCHPHIDDDGTLYNIGSSFHHGLKYTIYKTPPRQNNAAPLLTGTSTLGEISSSWTTNYGYFHSFGMTKNYLVFVEQPLLVNTIQLLATQAKGKSFKECLHWTPEEKVKFIIVDRTTGHRLKTQYITDTFFFLHHINAYEDDDHVVVDLIAFKSPVFEKFSFTYLNNGKFIADDPPTPRRFVLPLPTIVDSSPLNTNIVNLGYSNARAEKLRDGYVHLHAENMFEEGYRAGFDWPRINYKKCNGRKYRYVYGTGFFEQQQSMNAVCKGDIKTKQISMWKAEEEYYPGEPVFIAEPNAEDEDEGILITAICAGVPDKQDYFVFLDAKTLEELARAVIPVRVPLSVHGLFIPK